MPIMQLITVKYFNRLTALIKILSRAIKSLRQCIGGSVWCFASDTTATHWKEEHQFLWTRCAWMFTVLLLRHEADQPDNCHPGFWGSLVRWLWIVKTPLKMLGMNVKNAENQTRYNFSQWGPIYFSMCKNFGFSVQWPLVLEAWSCGLNLKLVLLYYY